VFVAVFWIPNPFLKGEGEFILLPTEGGEKVAGSRMREYLYGSADKELFPLIHVY
jgi:hypothetical protein